MGEVEFKEGMRVATAVWGAGHITEIRRGEEWPFRVRCEDGVTRSFNVDALSPIPETPATAGIEPPTYKPDTINALVSALGANAREELHPLLAAIASLAQEADDLSAMTADPHLSSSLARHAVRLEAALKLAREYV